MIYQKNVDNTIYHIRMRRNYKYRSIFVVVVVVVVSFFLLALLVVADHICLVVLNKCSCEALKDYCLGWIVLLLSWGFDD